jgi:hypothetical protein
MLLPFRHNPMCGDAIGLISTANVIISQSRCRSGRNCFLWPGSAQCFNLPQVIGLQILLNSLQLTIAVSVGRTPLLYPNRHNHSSVWEMNLVENDPLGRVVALSIWQSHCIIKSAAAVYASMNLLSRSLLNRDEYHLYPAKGFRD